MTPMVDRRNQWGFVWGVALATSLFWLRATHAPGSMGEDFYGPYAQAVEMEGWSLGFIGGSILTIYGIHINGRWRWSPALRIVGFLILSCLFLYLGFSSIFGEDGALVTAFTFAIFLPRSVWFMTLNIRDAWVRWGSYGRAAP